MSFVKRRIDVTISLGEGQFGEQQGKEVTLTGYRTSAAIVAYTADAQAQLQLRIWGLPLEMVNRLTTIGPIMTQVRKNSILVAVGDVDSALTVAYQGIIVTAYGDFNQSPNPVLNILAQASLVDAIKPVAARSYPGAANAVDILADIAGQMGVAFENHGVSAQLSNAYFPGTALDQLRACARAANVSYAIERGVLAIWPSNTSLQDDPALISPATGLVGYPAFSSGGIVFNTLYNPNLRLGARVNVESALGVANGEWSIYSYAHILEAEMPNGQWFTQLQCGRPINGQ